MSDFEDAAFYFESFASPPKPKRKKQAKKDRKEPKPKNSESIKAQEGVHSKFRETTKELKEKKKEKRKNKNKEKRKMKKKKNKLAPELDDFTLTQFISTQAKQFEKLEIPGKSKESAKEGKRNKMVAFDSLPTYIRVKRPQFASSTPKETEDVRRNENCSQVSSTGQTQNEAQDDVQWTSDDVNSQDLFITQKTFRTSPAKTFSGVASDEITASPQVFTQKNKSQKTAEKINTTLEITHKCPQEGAVLKLKQEKISSQTLKFKPSLAQQKKAAAPKWMNPFLDEPVVINETPEERSSSALPHGEPSLPRPRSANNSTQTENFFTSELSSYLHFCQKSRAAACVEDLKPLDLSLPQRVRKDLRLSVKMSVIDAKLDPGKPVLRGEMSDDGSKGVSEKLQEKPAEVKKEPETTPSPQSEADTKSADTTASSEDDHLARSAKKDLSQVGAVQLRLNKPFFFKTKGEWQSPRPESPLTKFSQGRNLKSKKCH